MIKYEFRPKIYFKRFAIWSNNSLQILIQKSEFFNRSRYDIQRATIRTSVVILNPDTINHLTDGVDPDIDTNAKQGYIVTHELLNFLNANVNITFDTTYGYFNKTSGTWTGLIKNLLDNEVDIGGTPIFAIGSRVPLVQYLYRTSFGVQSFLFQNPRLSFTDNLFLLPFSQLTWICVIFLIPVIGIGNTFVTYLAKVGRYKERKLDVGESVYMVLTIFCQQGFTKSIESVSGRVLMFFSFFTMMLIYVSYAASIVALLQTSSTRINSLQSLLESKMELGAEDTLYNRIYFPVN